MKKVNIYVFARFHAFDLAKELDKRNLLNKLISTYPYFIAKKWKIPKAKFHSRFIFEIIVRINRKFRIFNEKALIVLLKKLHAWFNSFHIKSSDLHISWSSSSFYLFKNIKLKYDNKILILERGSTHQLFHNEILSQEYTLHDLDFTLNYDSLRNELIEYEISDYIVVPSNFVKTTFLNYGISSNKIFVNPYGVDLGMFKSLGKEGERFRIIFTGNACIRKGFHYLIEAMKLLKDYDIELWHLGSVNPEIRSFDYNQKNIKYLGSKPQNELYKYYNQCDVFVLPSLEEGLAMVTLQAMACGLPVICTPNTGIENVLTNDGEEGFLIPIRDPSAIVSKVLQLYNDTKLKDKMGEAALKRVAEGFSWDDYGKRYIDFLKKIQNE